MADQLRHLVRSTVGQGQAAVDELLCHFCPLLHSLLALERDKLASFDPTISIHLSLALSLLLDQVPRHAVRHTGATSITPTQRDTAVRLAVAHAASFVRWSLHLDESSVATPPRPPVHLSRVLSSLPPAHISFLLLPLRHDATPASLSLLSLFLNAWQPTVDATVALSASFSRLGREAIDRCPATVGGTTVDQARRGNHSQQLPPILDETGPFFTPTGLRTSASLSLPLATLSRAHPASSLLATLVAFLQEQRASAVLISLSGGVDSNLLAMLAAHLRARRAAAAQTSSRPARGTASSTNPLAYVGAVHCCYGNRAVSRQESAFVARYCELLDIPLTTIDVGELVGRRGDRPREEYEAASRAARFEGYRRAAALTPYSLAKGEIGVVLGHHRGDLAENTLSNLTKGKGVLQLAGMQTVVCEDKEAVQLWRPLLAHGKDEIYAAAQKLGVPWTRDTTPAWSTRGKVRTNLNPLLTDVYGAGVEGALAAAAVESDALARLVRHTVLQPLTESSVVLGEPHTGTAALRLVPLLRAHPTSSPSLPTILRLLLTKISHGTLRRGSIPANTIATTLIPAIDTFVGEWGGVAGLADDAAAPSPSSSSSSALPPAPPASLDSSERFVCLRPGVLATLTLTPCPMLVLLRTDVVPVAAEREADAAGGGADAAAGDHRISKGLHIATPPPIPLSPPHHLSSSLTLTLGRWSIALRRLTEAEASAQRERERQGRAALRSRATSDGAPDAADVSFFLTPFSLLQGRLTYHLDLATTEALSPSLFVVDPRVRERETSRLPPRLAQALPFVRRTTVAERANEVDAGADAAHVRVGARCPLASAKRVRQMLRRDEEAYRERVAADSVDGTGRTMVEVTMTLRPVE